MVLEAARKDGQTATPDGELVSQDRIEGVRTARLNPILTGSGVTLEAFRRQDAFPDHDPQQINYCILRPSARSDWHMHRDQNDLIIPLSGEVHIGIFDDREDSPSQGRSMVVKTSRMRMLAVLVPRGVWHALKNAGAEEASYIVLTDRKYIHADPDDWRLKHQEPALHGIL